MEMTMINFRRNTAALALGLALAATATSTLAKSRALHSGQVARAQAQTVEGVSPDRARALRECSALAAPFKEATWNNTEFDIYRSCMAQHGQPE
jgi:hypothetical protein